MMRNQYDTDVTTFSPQGRIFQVEYAMEAVKQGSASVGLRSNTHVVIASLRRSTNELASYQQKIFEIDSHMGIVTSGLFSDGRVLCEMMRNECLNHKFAYGSGMQTGRLVTLISDRSQVYTQKSEKRPYGVGLLVAGYDKTGAHLYQTEPSGVFFEFHAQAIGARSQSARTYLEKHYDTFGDLSLDELIQHAITALKGCSQKKLTSRNVSVGYVGKDCKFTLLEGDNVRQYVAQVTQADDEDEPEEEEPEYMRARQAQGGDMAEEKEENEEMASA